MLHLRFWDFFALSARNPGKKFALISSGIPDHVESSAIDENEYGHNQVAVNTWVPFFEVLFWKKHLWNRKNHMPVGYKMIFAKFWLSSGFLQSLILSETLVSSSGGWLALQSFYTVTEVVWQCCVSVVTIFEEVRCCKGFDRILAHRILYFFFFIISCWQTQS